MQTGDISKIPADLQRITFLSVRRLEFFKSVVMLIMC
jgi:hypothetical protein